jgi:8-oxo-dGTP pyrophosphatase MutT (NUDIX family)
MTKIEFNNKCIFLTDNYNDLQRRYPINNALVLYRFNPQKLQQGIDLLMISEIEHLVIVGNEETSMQIISQTFKVIKAGGGLVMNHQNEYLFIYRGNKWDLPKGKLEVGEDIAACALREVIEETGIQQLEMLGPLTKTYHIYLENVFVFKETTWYLMHSEDKFLKPQIEEGIKKAVWINKKNINFQLKNTYESIKDILALAK